MIPLEKWVLCVRGSLLVLLSLLATRGFVDLYCANGIHSKLTLLGGSQPSGV